MSEKLKIISLGGLNEVGKNLTVYEYKGDILVVDCGLGFPDGEMYGVDVVIPNVTYLAKNREKIRGIVLTHGHEDHIGAIPYVLKEITAPIYATPLTAGLVKLKLEEHQMMTIAEIIEIAPGKPFKVGCFHIEPIHVNHSIAGSVALAVTTPIGTVVHTGDFKIDASPIQSEMTDLTRFGELDARACLLCFRIPPMWNGPVFLCRSERSVSGWTRCLKAANTGSSSRPLPPMSTGSSRSSMWRPDTDERSGSRAAAWRT
jgi:ribonuclease J